MISKHIDIEYYNKELRHKSPEQIIGWALKLTKKRILTTSFGKYSAVLLHTFYSKDKDIDVIWCDTGYNEPETYKHAINLINRFQLNIHVYTPLQSKAFLDATIGRPDISDPEHHKFTEIIKLEPFKRALKEHQPELWFTNIRNRQTEHRSSKGILSLTSDGILKVSPFFYWTDEDLNTYLKQHKLPKNSTYFDLTKVLKNRECGIHLH